MKRKILIPLFFGITIISVFIACQGIEIFDLPKSVDWNTPAWNNKNQDRDAIAEARQWYNLHREEIDAVMTRSNTRPLLGDMEPIWKQTYTRKTDEYTSVESYLRAYSGLHFVTPDAKQKFESTGDRRYLLSLTRLVQLKYQDGREMIGFFMTLSPSAKYFEATKFRSFYSTYAQRDKHYDGYVLYHDLQGRFVNGWQYTDGKITQSIKPKPDSLPLTRASLLVCLPVYEFHCEQQEGYVDEEGTPTAVSKCGEEQVGEICFLEEISEGENNNNNEDNNDNVNNGGGSGSLGGGGGGTGTSKPGEYQPEEPPTKPDKTITPENFEKMVMTTLF